MKLLGLSYTCLVTAVIGISLLVLALPTAVPAQTPEASDGLALSISAQRTAREGDSIEYTLELVNEGPAEVFNITVSESLPAEVMFVDAVSTGGGIYDPLAGTWSLPRLGTTDADRSAALQLQALVRADLLTDPQTFVAVVNRASVVQPEPTDPIEVEITTNVVCGFCIDWAIDSIDLGYDYRVDDKGGSLVFESRFFFYVQVINNGPVASEATLTATHFSASGSAFKGEVYLLPPLSVGVALDVGEKQTITFSTNWAEGPNSSGTISWAFEITDVSLLDPVPPNTATGSSFFDVDDGVSGGGGCFIATAAFGSELDPHVQSLRRFRDETLMRSGLGRRLVAWYYELSPPIARFIEEREALKLLTRLVLIPVIFTVDYPVLAFSLAGGTLLMILMRRRLLKTRSRI